MVVVVIGAAMKMKAMFWRLGDNGERTPPTPSNSSSSSSSSSPPRAAAPPSNYHPSGRPIHTAGLSRAIPGCMAACTRDTEVSCRCVVGLLTDYQQTVRACSSSRSPARAAAAAACVLLKEQNKSNYSAVRDSAAPG